VFSEWALKNEGTIFPISFSHGIVKNRSILNPSISVSQDGMGTLVFRTTNYRYLRPVGKFTSLTSTGAIQYLYGKNQPASNSFFFAQYDFSPNYSKSVVNIKLNKVSLPLLPELTNYNFESLEDLRICSQDGKLVLLGNLLISGNKRRPVYFEIGCLSKESELIPLNELHIIDYPNMMNIEKNWVPIEGDLTRVVRWPLSSESSGTNKAIITMLNEETSRIEEIEEHSNLFGGSPFIKYEKGFLAIVHTRELGQRKNNHKYLHKFMYYNSNFELLKSSKPFTFLGFETEFCSGISIYNEKIYISFSCNDSLNFVISFSKSSALWGCNLE
jgi:hypothetical protein